MPKTTSERIIDTVYTTQAARANSATAGATVTQTQDHGALLGLADDDHAQYVLATSLGGRTTAAANWTDLTDGGETTLHAHVIGTSHLISVATTLGANYSLSLDHIEVANGASFEIAAGGALLLLG